MILPFFRTFLPSSKTSYYLYYSLCYILIYILKIVFAFNAKGPVKKKNIVPFRTEKITGSWPVEGFEGIAPIT